MTKAIAVLTQLVMGFVMSATAVAHADYSWSDAFVKESVTDGLFTFGNNYGFGVTLNQESYSSDAAKPQGQLLRVHFQLLNISGRPQTYAASYQTLVDSKRRVFAAQIQPDPAALEYYPPVIAVNPGNAVNTGLVFDVPVGTSMSDYVLALRGSATSAGVGLQLPVGTAHFEHEKTHCENMIDWSRATGMPLLPNSECMKPGG
ncbi:MAG: DUF4352 domain-containing protein [Actinomycetes bacterium]